LFVPLSCVNVITIPPNEEHDICICRVKRSKFPRFLFLQHRRSAKNFAFIYLCSSWFISLIKFSVNYGRQIFSNVSLLMKFQVWMDVYSLPVPGSGGKTCSQIFEEAGCDTPASPSCGACLGGPKDTYARMNEPQASSLLLSQHLVIYKSSSKIPSILHWKHCLFVCLIPLF
jgi:hypothetical protein